MSSKTLRPPKCLKGASKFLVPFGKFDRVGTRLPALVRLAQRNGAGGRTVDVAIAWNALARGAAAEHEWRSRFEAYRSLYPAQAAEFERRMAGDLLPALAEKLPGVLATIAAKPDAVATRKVSQNALDALVPEFFGGSADLTGSNLTNFKTCLKAGRDQWGNHLSYGVREFGMAAILVGATRGRVTRGPEGLFRTSPCFASSWIPSSSD